MKILFSVLYIAAVLLLLVGAQLQVLKSALVCPDWPICFGEFLPLSMTPAFYEFFQRFLVGILGGGSLVWGIQRFKEIGIKALFPVFMVVLQALLGWAIYLYKLPTITSVLFLVFSLLFLAGIEGTKELQFDESIKDKWNPRLKDVVGFFLFVLLVQFMLGGILRKSSLLAQCESSMEFLKCWQVQSEIPFAGGLSLLHRTLGILTTLSGFFVFSYLIRELPKWRNAGIIGLLLMLTQIILGFQMGRSASRELIIWHFAVGLFSFCVLLFLIVRLRRYEKHFFCGPVPTFLNDLMDLFKPKLTVLVVITLLVGVFLAPIRMNVIVLFISLIAIWLQAAGSLSINCYLERDLDKLMERTKNRPLPAGRLAPSVAWNWGWSLIIIGTLILCFSANLLTASLGLFAALSYLFLYTPLKLKSPYALYVGAVPGALPTLMGWTTVTDSISGVGFYLFGILFLWQIPHFMAISLYRKNEYGMARFLTFAQTHSFSFLRMNIVLYSFIMMLFGLIPYFSGWRGEGYLYSSLMIGVILFLFSVMGFKVDDEESINKWARSYFWATLFYLPMIMGALLILR